MDSLTLLSWNVNGIRAIEKKGALKELIEKKNPSLLLLQEIKANPEQLSSFLLENKDYRTFYNPAQKKGYAGTAIWVRKDLAAQVSFSKGMSDQDDEEGRVANAMMEIKGKQYAFISTYMPNGGKSSEAWYDKIKFYADFLNYSNHLLEKGYEVVWAGDVNCAHQAIDLARPKENEGKIGFHPSERKAIDNFIESGWLDIWRHYNPSKKDVYSWWHLVTRARERNVGWRIDYFFCHEAFIKKVMRCDYLSDFFGSDHCPVLLKVMV